MSIEPQYFEIGTNTMAPCSLAREAYREAQQSWLCPGCVHVKPEFTKVDASIQENRPSDRPFNFVYAGMIPLVHRELLELFGQENVERDLCLGRVINDRGKLLNDWYTASGRMLLVVRGTTDASYRLCPECHRVLYFATGVPFLSRAPSGDATIYQSDGSSFVVPQEIAQRVRAKGWRRVRVKPLPILDPAPDGFGELLVRPLM